MDVPSHSGAFTPLIPLGLQFCDSNNQLLYVWQAMLCCKRLSTTLPPHNILRVARFAVLSHGFCALHSKDDAKTIQLVQTAVSQVMNLFPDVVVHLGGDETVPQGGCTWDNIHNFEKQMQVAW